MVLLALMLTCSGRAGVFKAVLRLIPCALNLQIMPGELHMALDVAVQYLVLMCRTLLAPFLLVDYVAHRPNSS